MKFWIYILLSLIICGNQIINQSNQNDQKSNVSFNQNKISISSDKLFKIANKYYLLNDLKALKSVVDKLQKEKLDIYQLAKLYRYYGFIHESRSSNESAFYFYNKSKKIYLQKKDFNELCTIYQDIALIQYYTNNFSESEKTLIEAIRIAAKLHLYDEIYRIYICLGLNQREQNNYKEALLYFHKALFLVENGKVNFHDFHNEYCYNNIGYIYLLMKNYVQANYFFLEAFNNISLKNNPIIYSRLLDNYGRCQIEMHNYKNVERILIESNDNRTKFSIIEGKNFNRLYLSQYYQAVKDTANARKYAKEAYRLSQEFKAPNDMLLCLKHLSEVDPGHALKYSSEYIKISDSMHQLERETRNKFAKIAYETEELTQGKETAEKQKSIFLGSTIAVTVMGLLLFIIVAQRNKQKELLFAQSQQKAKEEIYQLIQTQQFKIDEGRQIEKKRIARDLHDGVMNKLASIRFNLHILNKKTDPETIKQCINYVDGIHEIEKEIRDISHDLNKKAFTENSSFKHILLTLFEEQAKIMQAKLHTDIDETIKWETLQSDTKINLYRILQEALFNIHKHAQAEHVFVNISQQNGQVVLDIHDDGNGFAISHRKSGIGLQNLKVRTKECNGLFHVTSEKGKGTTILVSIPIHQPNTT